MQTKRKRARETYRHTEIAKQRDRGQIIMNHRQKDEGKEIEEGETNTHPNTQRFTDKQRETDRQRERQIERQRETERDRESKRERQTDSDAGHLRSGDPHPTSRAPSPSKIRDAFSVVMESEEISTPGLHRPQRLTAEETQTYPQTHRHVRRRTSAYQNRHRTESVHNKEKYSHMLVVKTTGKKKSLGLVRNVG